MKKIFSYILIFLFSILIIAGCAIPDQDGLPNREDNQTLGGGIGSSDEDASDDQDEKPTDETEPPATRDSGGSQSNRDPSNSGSPPAGQPDKNPQQDMAALKDFIQQVIDDPGSTIKAYLDTLNLAKQSGLDDTSYDAFYQTVLDKILAKMRKTLSRTDLCQTDLIKLIEVGRLMGMEDGMIDEATSKLGKYIEVKDLVTGAKRRYSTVPEDCSSVEYKYDSISKEGGYWVKTTASLVGDMTEQTIFDRVNSDARSYNWQRGKIEWNHADEYRDSCQVTKKSSIGRADLTKKDGSVTVYTSGTFDGMIISKAIQIEVTETLQQMDPKEDCSEYKPRSYTETGSITAYIKGNWADKYNLKVTINEASDPSEITETSGQETTFILAKLHIPFPE
ncbi:TPA: hypothetical protein HA246_02690 [Candidatus Woesearchaeota archaeon]|nr:hypothetical protein [Candidatus Woesearchaeota archaeon]